MGLKIPNIKPAPQGYRWIFTRFRRVKNSNKILDAYDYGYKTWCFLARIGGRK
ncbi:hypothetical protein ACED51_14260 [Photobacterium swingsii]|uniref:hypothetical protein n=1 Tax=Photobacterium swingsii TaxID=680026 RepID=UPI00352E9FDF